MNKHLIVTAMVFSAWVAGCDDDTSKATPPAQAAPVTESKSIQAQAQDAVQEGKQAVQTAVTEAKAAGQAAIDQAKPVITDAAAQVKQGALDAKQLVGDKVGQVTGSTTAPAAESFNYQQKVAESIQYVKENKLDLADKTLAQVEARKASIPASFHAKIESTRQLIESSRKVQGTGLALPKF